MDNEAAATREHRGGDAPFVDPAEILQFLDHHYLQSYLAEGGSKLKLVTGREGAGKSRLLSELRGLGLERGYCVAAVDAATLPLGRFDEFYRAVVGDLPLDTVVGRLAQDVVQDLGYDPAEIPQGDAFLPWVTVAHNRVPEIVARDIKTELEALYRDPNLVDSFATAFMFLTLGALRGGPTEQAEPILAWVRGQPQPKRLLAAAHLHRSIDRYSARHMLRSLLFLLRRLHYQGLIVTVDNLDALTAAQRQPDRVHYTKLRREDAYESLRELIDDAENLPGLLVVAAARPALFTDHGAGIPSYPALQLRVQNEVDAREFNRFADLLDLDRAWACDWPRYRAELARRYILATRARGGTPGEIDVERFGLEGLTSPIPRLVRAIQGGDEAA